MKNWNLWFFVAVIAIGFISEDITSQLKKGQQELKDEIFKLQSFEQSISDSLGITNAQKVRYLKLIKNLDVWEGTSCISCHNTIPLALPIHKISLQEAIQIVRYGNEATKAAGMPTYSAHAGRDRDSISDKELKLRLQALYIKQFLDNIK